MFPRKPSSRVASKRGFIRFTWTSCIFPSVFYCISTLVIMYFEDSIRALETGKQFVDNSWCDPKTYPKTQYLRDNNIGAAFKMAWLRCGIVPCSMFLCLVISSWNKEVAHNQCLHFIPPTILIVNCELKFARTIYQLVYPFRSHISATVRLSTHSHSRRWRW